MKHELVRAFSNIKFGNIRVVLIGDKEHFVATDVAKSLGYKDQTNAIKQHCRRVVKHHIPHPQSRNKTLEVNVIPEGDLYRLITNSQLPSAEEFESWIFDEVLPTIRKHGAYLTENTLEQALQDPIFAIGLLTKLKEEKEKRAELELENAQQAQIINEMQPKVTYYDLILQNNQLMPITLIAKDYGMSGQALNKKLNELGVQYYQSGTWLLYARYQAQGYTQSKTQSYKKQDGTIGVKLHTQWTQAGRLFIYDLMKQENILPVIERNQETAI